MIDGSPSPSTDPLLPLQQTHLGDPASQTQAALQPPDRYAVDSNDMFAIERLGQSIRLPARYRYIRPIGSGGGGMVL